MNRLEFKLIKHFRPEEITATGARLSGVQLELLLKYDEFRDGIGLPVFFVPNGLTTGDHKSPYHKAGLAGDCIIKGAINHQTVFRTALNCGFKGIGFYWNGKLFSFHLDIGDDYRFWKGIKTGTQKTWAYSELVRPPNE